MAEQAYGPDTNRALRQALVDALNEFVNLLPEPSDEDGDAYLAAMRAGDLPNWGMDDQPLTETTEEWAARVRATRPPGPDASSTRAFAGLPESVSAARSWVAGFFPSPAAAADAALMTSELFTNVILYSASRPHGFPAARSRSASCLPGRPARSWPGTRTSSGRAATQSSHPAGATTRAYGSSSARRTPPRTSGTTRRARWKGSSPASRPSPGARRGAELAGRMARRPRHAARPGLRAGRGRAQAAIRTVGLAGIANAASESLNIARTADKASGGI